MEVSRIRFSLLRDREVREGPLINNTALFRNKIQTPNGLASPSLGTDSHTTRCAVCLLDSRRCMGHPGHIDFTTWLLHPWFAQTALKLMRSLCVWCCQVGDACQCGGARPTFGLSGDDLRLNFTKQQLADMSPPERQMAKTFGTARMARVLAASPLREMAGVFLSSMRVPPLVARPAIRSHGGSTPFAQPEITMALVEAVRAGNRASGARMADARRQLANILDNSGGGDRRGQKGEGLKDMVSGKTGLLRRRLLGKRLDHSARMVIHGDPDLAQDEVGIPASVAARLHVSGRVAAYNLQACRQLQQEQGVVWVRRRGRLWASGPPLQVGDEFARPLRDGDLVMLNRQPTLHRPSQKCFRVRVTQGVHSMGLPLTAAPSFNADFDGDEMCVVVPQTEEARAEAKHLMLASCDAMLDSDEGGTTAPLVFFNGMAGVADLGTQAHFFDAADMSQRLWSAGMDEMPQPAILKPKRLWTGPQLVSAALPRTCHWSGGVGQDAPLVVGGEWLRGPITKQSMGQGPSSLSRALLKQCGGAAFSVASTRLQKVGVDHCRREGFTFALDECYSDLPKPRVKTSSTASGRATRMAHAFDEAVQQENDALPATSWMHRVMRAKGGPANCAQIRCMLGAQTVAGGGPEPLPGDRGSTEPRAEGFVSSSFAEGLDPTEWYHHCWAGRMGIVDTALSTAQTGYLSRCLRVLMEGFVVAADGTITDGKVDIGRSDLDPGSPIGVIAAQQLGSKYTQSSLDNFHKSGMSSQFSGAADAGALVAARVTPPRYRLTRPALIRRPLRDWVLRVGEASPDHPLVHAYNQVSGIAKTDGFLFYFDDADVAYRAREAARRHVSDVDAVCHGTTLLVRALHGRKDPAAHRGELNRVRERVLGVALGDYDRCAGRIGEGANALDALARGDECLSPMEVLRVFGIGAAHRMLAKQLREAFPSAPAFASDLLAAAMCRKGRISGANRHGMPELGMDPFTLMLFENPKKAVVQACASRRDIAVSGPSANIVLNNRVRMGTGAVDVLNVTSAKDLLINHHTSLFSELPPCGLLWRLALLVSPAHA